MLDDIKLDLLKVMRSANISEFLDKESLDELGLTVCEEFDADRASRADWETRNDKANKLALQVVEKKTTPWPDAANVKFPLLTIAAMQYHSRAYPALINGPRPVACRVMAPAPASLELPPPPPQQPPQPGQQQRPDPAMQAYQQAVIQAKQKAQQQLTAYHKEQLRAQRVAEHMSYQILEEDQQWEEEQDRTLLIQGIAGCAFKKTFFDPVTNQNRSECVLPADLVVSYYTKNLDTSPRYTHIIRLSRNQIRERQVSGIFNEFEDENAAPTPTLNYSLSVEADERAGVHPNPSDRATPYELLEQYRWIDLDGDGYSEPYVVTVRYDTRQVLRIVARFTEKQISTTADRKKIARIVPIQFFTKYSMVPSPDGGFYDIGFGALLGPINHSIDTAINQLLDAGSLSNAGGGFLGRGFKARKGDMRFRLGEWKQTDSTGDDLKKSIFPLPIREPSNVLFSLLSLLIQYGQQVAGATDSMQGQNPGQNTPAETSRNTLEQGMKVFNGIYKRTHRAFTQELRKLFELNKVFLSEKSSYRTPHGLSSAEVFQVDYSGDSSMIRPAADPFYMSDSQRLQQATAVLQAAHSSPGYDLYLANKHYLEALKVSNVDELLPNPKGPNAVPPPPNPKLQIEQLHAQVKQGEFQVKLMMEKMKLAAAAEQVQAEVEKLHAEATLLLSQAKGVDTGHQIALINAQIAAKKNDRDASLKSLEILQKVMEVQQSGNSTDRGAGLAPSPGNGGIPPATQR